LLDARSRRGWCLHGSEVKDLSLSVLDHDRVGLLRSGEVSRGHDRGSRSWLSWPLMRGARSDNWGLVLSGARSRTVRNLRRVTRHGGSRSLSLVILRNERWVESRICLLGLTHILHLLRVPVARDHHVSPESINWRRSHAIRSVHLLVWRVHVHLRRVVWLVGCQSGRRHGGCSVMWHSWGGSRASTGRLRRVRVLRHAASALLVGRHSTAACIRALELTSGRISPHRLVVVVLRREATAAAATLISTTVVSRSAVANCLAMSRRLRVSSRMWASHRSLMRDRVLLHVTVVIAREASECRRWLCAGRRTLAAALLWDLRNRRRGVCRRSNSGVSARNRDRHCAARLGCAVGDSRRLVEAELDICLTADRTAVRDMTRGRVRADGD
jgi:hypothetical protein